MIINKINITKKNLKLRIFNLTRDFILFFLLLNSIYNCAFGQTQNYKSPNYNYSIDIPTSFKKKLPTSTNCDLFFSESTGASINMVVVKRDFKTQSPHELSKEMILDVFKTVDSTVKVFDDEKIIVDGKKCFKHVRTSKLINDAIQLNTYLNYVCFTYYNGNMQYVLTLCCETKNYDKYNTVFDVVGKSVKF